ncbi:MAG: AAA family ATPase [Limnohabitans sp.]
MSITTKYTPASLNDIVYPNAATELRVKSLGNGSREGHVLFYGPRGTAKTTTANLLAHAIGGPTACIESDFHNLMAMPNLKGYLKQGCFNARTFYNSKLILLFNEFDNYKPTPYQLWDAMDELQSAGLMVIITTNEQANIHPSVRDRCVPIEFPGLTAVSVLPRAQQILNSEGLNLPNAQVLSYLTTVERFGSFRRYLEMLDTLLQIHKSSMPFPQWSGQKPSLTVI